MDLYRGVGMNKKVKNFMKKEMRWFGFFCACDCFFVHMFCVCAMVNVSENETEWVYLRLCECVEVLVILVDCHRVRESVWQRRNDMVWERSQHLESFFMLEEIYTVYIKPTYQTSSRIHHTLLLHHRGFFFSSS